MQDDVDAGLQGSVHDGRVERVVGDDDGAGRVGGIGQDGEFGDLEHRVRGALEPQHHLAGVEPPRERGQFREDGGGVRDVDDAQLEAALGGEIGGEAERAGVGVARHEDRSPAGDEREGGRRGPETRGEDERRQLRPFEGAERLLERVPGGVGAARVDAVARLGGACLVVGRREDDRRVDGGVVLAGRAPRRDGEGVGGQVGAQGCHGPSLAPWPIPPATVTRAKGRRHSVG
jgi:hypothetical protein